MHLVINIASDVPVAVRIRVGALAVPLVLHKGADVLVAVRPRHGTLAVFLAVPKAALICVPIVIFLNAFPLRFARLIQRSGVGVTVDHFVRDLAQTGRAFKFPDTCAALPSFTGLV